MTQPVIRDASEADGPACATIYRPFVADTAVSFEIEPPSEAAMATRIRESLAAHAWLVAELGGQVAGYAYGRPFAAREAYRWSCETSIYLSPAHRGAGLGRALYEALLNRLAGRGYRVAVAKMTLPNPASEALHTALGFHPVGVHRRIGFKHGTWYDVAISQRDLATGEGPPPELH
jgi:L-amino acid N-acyltransferase YncA